MRSQEVGDRLVSGGSSGYVINPRLKEGWETNRNLT